MDKIEEGKLFQFFKDGLSLNGRKFSYYAWESNYIHSFKIYIDGYINATEMIIHEYSKTNRIDILDSIVYPLCFMYRHIIELYIKYFYFKYSNDEENKKRKFVGNVNHGLQRAWNSTKPCLLVLYKKINCKVDLDTIDSYIKQLDEFDSDSFMMRYPIEKNLKRTHPKYSRLDVLDLHAKIMKMVDMFRELDYQLNRVIADNTINIEFVEIIITLFQESKNDIAQVIDILSRMASQNTNSIEGAFPEGLVPIELFKLPEPNGNEVILCRKIMEMPSKHACLLGLLSGAGLDIVYGDPLLSTAAEEKQEDFLKYLEILYVSSGFLDFDGTYSNDVMCYAILEKVPKLMHEALKSAYALMEVCSDNSTLTARRRDANGWNN